MGQKVRLGELLTRAGVISSQQLEAAMAEHERRGERLGRVLVERGYVSEAVLVRVLSRQLGVRPANLQRAWVPAEILQKLTETFLRDNAICPEGFDEPGRALRLAMADPTNVTLVDEVRFRTGLKVSVSIAGEREIEATVDRMCGWIAGPTSDFQNRPSSPDPGDALLNQLSVAQSQQERALRVLVDILIENGVFTRDEYLDLLSRQ
ncbi:MAG: hypothetical protein ACFB9M_18535 [Myxococcota bacterium]